MGSETPQPFALCLDRVPLQTAADRDLEQVKEAR